MNIGTPPQHFTVAVDLSWTDLFVPSSECNESGCQEYHSTYNASASSTYTANGSATALRYAGLHTLGLISQDVLFIGSLEIKGQQFEEATELRPGPGYWTYAFDGVLGLAPPSAGSPLNKLHPLSMMVSQDLLERNVFGLKLPLDNLQEEGELTLGGINDELYIGELINIPVVYEMDPRLHGKWTVEAQHLSLGDGSVIYHTLDGYTAFFETGNPFIGLPVMVANEIFRAIGAIRGPLFYSVWCEARDTLPNLVFNLEGVEVEVTPHDYILNARERCPVMLEGHLEEEGETPYLRLGSAFLRGFYSVFDLDEKIIGCEDFLCHSVSLYSKEKLMKVCLQLRDCDAEPHNLRLPYGRQLP